MAEKSSKPSSPSSQTISSPWFIILAFAATAAALFAQRWAPFFELPLFATDTCPAHQYKVELVSFDPLVIYLDNFLSEREIKHVLDTVEDQWQQSPVWVQKGEVKDSSGADTIVNKAQRNSQSSWVPSGDAVGKCISDRAKSLLGNLQHVDIEPIQIVKYTGGERFRLHYDWLPEPVYEVFDSGPPARASTRLTTFFIYLDDQCEGGETYFPHIHGVGPDADGDRFARTDGDKGLLVKPRRGSGVLWTNMFMNGTGDWRTAHAGLEVRNGKKIGMNLLTVYYLDDPIVGTHVPERHRK